MRHEDRRTLMSGSPDDGEAVASRRGEERGGDASLGLMEQVTEDRQRIQMALRTGPKQRREHLLGVSTAPRAIPATDLAQHDSGADGLFGAPVRRVDSRVQQKREHAGEFACQVSGEALDVRYGTASLDEAVQAVEEMAPGDGDAVCRHGARLAAVAHFERLRQDRGDLWRVRRARMISLQRPTSAEEMVETGLPDRGRELPIGCPAVADQCAVKVLAEDRGGFVKAATRLNRIDRRGRRCIHPKPLKM